MKEVSGKDLGILKSMTKKLCTRPFKESPNKQDKQLNLDGSTLKIEIKGNDALEFMNLCTQPFSKMKP